ncbi:hypothetical protein NDN08_005136 [Rhodosorus marinus]|uniref:PROP1-like PPR domain-containing protein n=1 Tax=Rhodosorus marinus TaxID=101924 RepID=A0AAV8V4E9_9RHOD|nr:hypothetical protein NDN08_005136 [Rhodosorus marinus]
MVEKKMNTFAMAIGFGRDLVARPDMPPEMVLKQLVAQKKHQQLIRSIYQLEHNGKKVGQEIYDELLKSSAAKPQSFVAAWNLVKEHKRLPSDGVIRKVFLAMADSGIMQQQRFASKFKEDLSKLNIPLSGGALSDYSKSIVVNKRSRRSAELYGVCQEISNLGPEAVQENKSVFTRLMVDVAKNGQLETVEDMISELREFGVPVDVDRYCYTARIIALGRRKEYKEVVRVAKEASQRLTFDIRLYHSMMDAFQRCGKLRETIKLFYKLRDEYSKEDKELTPNVTTYNLAIDALCRHGGLKEAEELYNEMMANGLRPRTMDMNVVVNSYAQAGLPEEAKAVIERLGAKPDAVTYSSLVLAHVRGRDILGAEKILDDLLTKFGVDRTTQNACNTLLNAYGKLGSMLKFKELIARMKQMGIHMGGYTDNIIIDSYLKNGDLEAAKAHMRGVKLRSQRLDPVAYTSLIHAYGRRGQLEHAIHVFEECLEDGVQIDVAMYTAMVDAMVKNNDFEGAEKLVEIMNQNNVKMNVVAFTSIIDGFAKRGNHVGVLKIVEQMRELEISPSTATYNCIISSYAGQMDLVGVQATFIEMLRSGCAPSMITFNQVINAHARACDLGGIIKTFEEMQRRGLGWTFDTSPTALLAFANQDDSHLQLSSSIGPSATRFKAVDGVRNRRSVAQTFLPTSTREESALDAGLPENLPAGYSVVVAAKKLGADAVERAFQRVQQRGESPGFVGYATLIKAYSAKGDLPAAIAALNDMESENLKPDLGVFNSLLACCTLLKETETAVDVMNRLTELKVNPDSFTYNAMMYIYALKGNKKSVGVIRRALKRTIRSDVGVLL